MRKKRPFKDNLKVVAYADIHHGEYANGRTQSDMIAAEEFVTKTAVEFGADWVVFAGDAFRSRNPHDECKTRWLESRAHRMENLEYIAKTTGHPTHQLDVVGNHCRWYKAQDSGHVYEALEMLYKSSFTEDTRNALHISAQQELYAPEKDPRVVFFTLPAQVEFSQALWDHDECQNEDRIRICVFHGMVKGCLLNPNGHRADTGIPMEILDQPYFDFVIGGDIHIPQIFDFNNAQGGYVGSTLQLDHTDMGEDRGVLTIEFKKGEFEPHVKFVPFPHAKLEVLDWSAKEPLPDLAPYTGSLLRLRIKDAGALSSIDLEHQIEKVRSVARHLEVIPIGDAVQKAIEMQNEAAPCLGPLDDFNRYMDAVGVQDVDARARRLKILGGLIDGDRDTTNRNEPTGPNEVERRTKEFVGKSVAASPVRYSGASTAVQSAR
jgi:DNA repair exonuclease SbcCD nuclease subunit